jgi:hypothetical protein
MKLIRRISTGAMAVTAMSLLVTVVGAGVKFR